MENLTKEKSNLMKAAGMFLIFASVFVIIKILSEWRGYGMMGSGGANVITLTGHGEVQAVPDIANVYFTLRKEAKTVKEAQDAVAVVEKKALDFLKQNGVEEKDIKATSASFNPKYEYTTKAALYPCNEYGCPPQPGGKSVIVGYEAYETITVKIRKTDDVGKIIQGLGTLGISDLNGPNFAIDDEDALKAEARKLAITDAKEKAQALAKDLGVSLGRVANFSENGNYPMLFKTAAYAEDSSGRGGATPAPAELPKGENTVSSDVSISYEIR